MLRGAQAWLPGLLARRVPRPPPGACRDLIVAVCDHFEPLHRGASAAEALARVRRWRDGYAGVQSAARDAGGRPPLHSFFYPIEQGGPDLKAAVAGLAEAGLGEVEVHLHHRDDTAATLRAKLDAGVGEFARLGCFTRDPRAGVPGFAFIHGNWALDHSHPEGKACGVANELDVLREAGCYADFTFPCAPDPCQPRMVNAIYYAHDTPAPRSHDRGVPVSAGKPPAAGPRGEPPFLLVQGPLGLNWRRRKLGVFPRLENADLTAANPPTPDRLRLWLDLNVSVEGRPEWTFIKLHTHGCKPGNDDALLGGALARFYGHLAEAWNDGTRHRVHFVTAREMTNLVLAAEAGASGDPTPWRDYRLPPPPNAPRR